MIIASISSIPDRLESLFSVLNSLANQSIKPDLLIVSIYDFYPRLSKYYQSKDEVRLKEYLSKYPIQNQIIKATLDIGPCTKLLSPINNLKLSTDDYIFIFDDDTPLYEKTIESLLLSYLKNPSAIYGLMGVRQNNYFHSEAIPDSFDYFTVNILGGYRGVLYSCELLDKEKLNSWCLEIINKSKESNLLAMHDDHIFSYFFKNEGIERRVAKLVGDKSVFHYIKIDNTNGIFNDDRNEISLSITYDWIKEKNLNWLLETPY